MRSSSRRSCFLSARWEVKKGEWNGLPIEIYHDPKHAYNVDRMIDATRKSLDYLAEKGTDLISHSR